MKYGLPYRGSKSRIAADIVEHLPSGPALYDLFAGGCAVTHAAMIAGRWECYGGLVRAPQMGERHLETDPFLTDFSYLCHKGNNYEK